MSDLQVTVDTRQVEVETFYWKCPGCGCNMSDCRHPGDDREDQLCRECYREWERQRFDGHFAQVAGAQVTAVIQPEEAFDWQDVKRLGLTDAQGRRWLVTSDDIIYVYLDERTPGVQPKMVRPEWDELVRSTSGAVLSCSCGQVLPTVEVVREHWQQGHFDYVPDRTPGVQGAAP